MHTHLYPAAFGKIGLWRIDELLTYHYLEAEFFRHSDMTAEKYWTLSKPSQADAIWKTLFVDNTPISEATRGVIAVLNACGLSTDASDLIEARAFFAEQSPEAHIDNVLQMAGVSTVVMTNDPLDREEIPVWMKGVAGATYLQVAEYAKDIGSNSGRKLSLSGRRRTRRHEAGDSTGYRETLAVEL